MNAYSGGAWVRRIAAWTLALIFFQALGAPVWADAIHEAMRKEVLSEFAMARIKGGNASPPNQCPDPNSSNSNSALPKPPCPGSNSGNPGGCVTDPVVYTGGKLTIPAVDVSIDGPGRHNDLPLRFGRVYISQSDFAGVLGPSWSSILDMKIEAVSIAEVGRIVFISQDLSTNPPTITIVRECISPARRNLVVRDEFGNVRTLTDTTSTANTQPQASCNTKFVDGPWTDGQYYAEEVQDGVFLVKRPDGTKILYGSTNRPEYIEDRNGNRITFGYQGGLVSSLTDGAGRTLTFEYTQGTRLIRMTDPAGRVWNYQYRLSRLFAVVDPLGRAVVYTQGLAAIPGANPNLITSVTDAMGYTTRYEYQIDEGIPRVSRMVKSDGKEIQLEHNVLLGVTLMVDERGQEWRYEYRTKGLTTVVLDPVGGLWQYEYDATGQRTLDVNPLGETNAYAYDARQRLIAVTDALGRMTTYEYDNLTNQLAAVTDPNGHITRTIRDGTGNVVRTIDGSGRSNTFEHNAQGATTVIRDDLNRETKLEYDAAGNLVRMINPAGDSAVMAYDSAGRIVSRTDELGWTTTFEFDEGDRLLIVHYPDGTVNSIDYDDNDRIVARTDAMDRVTQFVYAAPSGSGGVGCNDCGGGGNASAQSAALPIAVMDPLGNVTSFAYDVKGNTTAIMDANGITTTFRYNIWNQQTVVEDANGGVTAASYDLAKRMTAITDAKGQTTSFEHDRTGRSTATTYPDGSRELMAYDAAGNLTGATNRAGQMITFAYDGANRLTHRSGATGRVVMEYDAVGRLRRADDGALGMHRFVYDLLDRVVEAQQPNGFVVRYEYDASGYRKAMTYPGGRRLLYDYDAMNRMKKITDAGRSFVFEYDAAGQRTKLTYPNAVTANYSYDGGGRLTGIEHLGIAASGTRGPGGMSGGTDTITYAYDAAGNISSRADQLGTHNYGYDNLYQVTSADYAANPPQQDESFTYDLVGNRTATTRGSGTTAYQSNNLNQYTQVGDDPYSYDANENLTNDGRLTLAYDSLNRLKQTVVPLEPPATRGKGRVPSTKRFLTLDYTHDFMNRIMTRKETRTERGNATQTRYSYDGWSTIGEAVSSTSLNRIYVIGPMVDEVLSQDDNSGKVYLLHDHLGSTVAATDDRGKIIERYVYDVFGNVTITDARGKVSATGGPRVRSLFTGRWYEPDAKLYDYRNRWYSLGVGAFLQTDPIGFLGGMNLYTYVHNSPLFHIDPYGLATIELAGQTSPFGIYGHAWFQIKDDAGNVKLAIELIANVYSPSMLNQLAMITGAALIGGTGTVYQATGNPNATAVKSQTFDECKLDAVIDKFDNLIGNQQSYSLLLGLDCYSFANNVFNDANAFINSLP